jgi:hypothetical protein
MATVVIRPGWVWGTADDPQTASFVQAVRAGQMRLIDGGRHRIVATHIDNLIHAISLAIDHGAGGRGYYVFDDGSTTIRDFLTGLLQAHGLTLPEATIPGPAAAGLARALDIAWRITRRQGDPPITRMIVELNRRPFLISDVRARQELRYQPITTRQQGIQRLRDAMRATVQPVNPGVLPALTVPAGPTDVAARTADAWNLWDQSAEYRTDEGRIVPRLVRDARIPARTAEGQDRRANAGGREADRAPHGRRPRRGRSA